MLNSGEESPYAFRVEPGMTIECVWGDLEGVERGFMCQLKSLSVKVTENQITITEKCWYQLRESLSAVQGGRRFLGRIYIHGGVEAHAALPVTQNMAYHRDSARCNVGGGVAFWFAIR